MDGLESEVIRTMIEHIQTFLEKANPIFSGLPVCPFAKKARLENKILYQVYPFSAQASLNTDPAFARLISEFAAQNRHEVLLIIHPDPLAITAEQTRQLVKNLAQELSEKQLVAFGGHPDDNFNIQGLHTRREPYPNLTIQSEQLVRERSQLLSKTSYYANWSTENLSQIGLPKRS